MMLEIQEQAWDRHKIVTGYLFIQYNVYDCFEEWKKILRLCIANKLELVLNPYWKPSQIYSEV